MSAARWRPSCATPSSASASRPNACGADRRDQRLLVREVPVGRHRAAADLGSQAPHRERALAFLDEDPRRRLAEPLADRVARLARARPRLLLGCRGVHVYSVRLMCESGKRPSLTGAARDMTLPAVLRDRLRLPVIGSPLFIVSGPGAGDRPVQGRRRRLVPVAERAAALAAGRVAGRDHRDAGRLGPRASRGARRAVRGQPDRPQDQQPARGGRRALRQVQGPGGDHLAGRPRGRQRRGARLGRRRAARHHQQRLRPQGDREGRRRPDPGGGRRRRPRRAALALRHDPGAARVVRRADRALRRHRQRPRGAGGAGDGRRPRLHRLGLHRDAGGARRPGLQGHDRRQRRRGHRLHQPLHRRARQLPAALDRRARASIPTTCRRPIRRR